ncbi:MAG: tRNA preQ1(34) S-adenosylmethionine ribosyltransferase-isomerase QueA [Phycisphaerales bacterium]
MLRTDDLDYELPDRLIATRPADRRDDARLLVMRRQRDEIEHRRVRDLPDLLGDKDAVVVNDTRVAPARLVGRRADTGGRIEGLYLARREASRWECLLKSNGRLRPGLVIDLQAPDGGPSGVSLELESRSDAAWLVHVKAPADGPTALERAGHTPLPPYIVKARSRQAGLNQLTDREDRERYQTVYAGREGAVAAPTAGLHFTSELMARLSDRGVALGRVTLHVGAGTFKPVDAEFVDEHPMHAEWYEAPAETAELVRRTRVAGGRVIAVGTTTVRTLESLPDPLPSVTTSGETRLLITPGYEFRFVDGLMTNFHLPRSTLLALVGAMVGVDRLLAAYREAIAREYRFYSYGDAMLILP